MDKKEFYKKVAKNIQRVRKQHGYTQETFALKMGVTISYASKVESGALNLSLGKIFEIAEFLNSDISELLIM